MKKLILSHISVLAFLVASSQTMLDTALNFSAKDVHGNTIELFSFLDDGKIVVIDFFSSS